MELLCINQSFSPLSVYHEFRIDLRQLSETFRTDIRIEGDSLKNYHMTATFREGESLTEILDLLKDAGNFTYKKENNTIILTTKLN